jgi:hypothetical protein
MSLLINAYERCPIMSQNRGPSPSFPLENIILSDVSGAPETSRNITSRDNKIKRLAAHSGGDVAGCVGRDSSTDHAPPTLPCIEAWHARASRAIERVVDLAVSA